MITEMDTDIIHRDIEFLLLHFGLDHSYKGFPYLQDAIISVVVSPILPRNMKNAIYSKLSKKYGVPESQIECNIRHCVNKICSVGIIDDSEFCMRKDSSEQISTKQFILDFAAIYRLLY